MSLSTSAVRASGAPGTTSGPSGRGTGQPGAARAAGPATAVFRPAGGSGEGAPATDPRPVPWLLGSVGAVAAVALGGWLLVLSPQAAATAAVDDQTAQTAANEALLTTKVAQLRAQFSDLPQYQAQLARARAQVPTDPQLAELLRTLRDAAATSGVTLTSVVPAAPVAVASATTDPAATGAADGTAAATGGATASTDAAPASDGTPAAVVPATTTDPTTGLVRVPLTLTANGTYTAVEAFLAAVQQEDRLVLLTSVALAPMTSGDGQALLTLTASGSVFALPASDAEVAALATGTSTTTSSTAATTALPPTALTAATPAATR